MQYSLTKYLPIVALAVSAVFAPGISAQNAAPQLMVVNDVLVKPDMMETFMDLHANVYIPQGRRAGTQWRYTGTETWGDSFRVRVVLPIDNFAALNTPQSVGANANEVALSGDIWARSVNARRTYILRQRTDLSMASTPVADFYSTYRFVVKPGKADEFEKIWTEDVLPASRAAGIQGTQVFQVAMGGNTNEYMTRTPIDSFAAFDEGTPLRALSPQEQLRVNGEVGELVDLMEFAVVQTNRDLSYGLEGLQP